MKHLAFAGLALAFGLTVGAADAYKPAPWNLAARQKFAEQRFGIFIHWGLYVMYAQGEWYLSQNLEEPVYARAKDGFCPSEYDAAEWVRVFKDAGAKYVTITSRHHDGFSLWPTKADDGYNVGQTPFKRDILGELAAACQAEGLQLNFYYSLMDWHRLDYPKGKVVIDHGALKLAPNYDTYLAFMKAQITELIDNYHPGNIWFDGEWDHTGTDWATKQPMKVLDWHFDEIYDLIHSKKTLVANNNHAAMRPKEDIQVFERDLPGSNDSGFSPDVPISRTTPLEQCDVIQDSVWGYKIGEKKFRTAPDVVAMAARAAANDANLLMNIGPDASGRLPAKAVSVMKDVGVWFRANGESIYGTQAAGLSLGKDVVSTRKGNVLYLHFLKPGIDKFAFKMNGTVESATYLATGAKASVERTPSGDAVATVARAKGDDFDIVLKIVVK